MVDEIHDTEPVRPSRPIVWIAGFAAVVVLVILVLPALQAARTAARRMESSNNLKQIALAMHNYHDALRSFPPGGTFREDGTGLHGWSTLILPYLQSTNFGEYIDQALPWDDPTQIDAYIQNGNRIYRDPGLAQRSTPDGFPVIHYAANEWLFHRNSHTRLDEITNQERTLMVSDAFGDFVPIGSPTNWRDPTVPFRTSPREFGNSVRRVTLVLLVDGSVQAVAPNVDPELFNRFAGPISLRPITKLLERPTEPYRLKSKDYWRYLIVNEHGEHHRKGGYFAKVKLSTDGRMLEAIFNDKLPKSDEELTLWREKLKPFLNSKNLERAQVSGTLDAEELEPFIEIPSLKRLSISAADIHGDKEAVWSKMPKTIEID